MAMQLFLYITSELPEGCGIIAAVCPILKKDLFSPVEQSRKTAMCIHVAEITKRRTGLLRDAKHESFLRLRAKTMEISV